MVTHSWQQINQEYLAQALAEVRMNLQQYIARSQGTAESDAQMAPDEDTTEWEYPPALVTLCNALRLTSFERQILLLCAGVELSGSLAQLCATAQGHPQFTYPTVSLVLAVFPEANMRSFAPVAPLRRWRLIEVVSGESLSQSKLGIDERVLHYLTGFSYLDDRLQGLIELLPPASELAPSHRLLAERIAKIWSENSGKQPPVIQLSGDEPDGKWAIAAAACATLEMQLHVLRAADIPQAVAEREALIRLWEREAILSDSALLLECEDSPGEMRTILPFVENLQSLLIINTQEYLRNRKREILRLDVYKPDVTEQKSLWQNALGDLAGELNGQLDTLISQFSLSASVIYDVCHQVRGMGSGEWGVGRQGSNFSPSSPSSPLLSQIWDTCRTTARPRLEDLAQRLVPKATFDDLVLPDTQGQILHDIAAQLRQRVKVYETWEFALRSVNGLGISALFAGASGTGKTMAAEVLAQELRLDLYRIDLSQVVSKYIGETEKNLRRVFDAAETGGAILLFDEADALFGKRSEVKDSHDRYANIEVSYLLQRMEAYRGLAILTTNLKNAIDTAFLRRIRFVVQFPFPDFAQRQEIWRRIFPPKMPIEGIDVNKLAKLNVTGGNIRNIALNAAFIAADTGEAVQMKHLLRAAQSEYAKLEKQLTEAEVGGWV
ncbi:ATP-binding protein [Nostoc sp. CCY 9925]|uniref:ATP-binding protein n=1 Tax=Nostoc sp. CCY 9925 TaxID=3103865 RepID=UPI0039C6C568